MNFNVITLKLFVRKVSFLLYNNGAISGIVIAVTGVCVLSVYVLIIASIKGKLVIN